MATGDSEGLLVEATVTKGFIVLKLNYSQELMFAAGAGITLAREALARYQQLREERLNEVKTTSCIVVIVPRVAGSPVVRALFSLWKEVVEKVGGQLICVDYPEEYLDTLMQLGLPSLAGFSLASSLEEAMG